MTKRKTATTKKKSTPKKSRKKKVIKVSYYRKPDDMTLDEWQVALRKQFGKESKFKLENQGEHPVFSDFILSNPDTNTQYKIAIRSQADSANFCSCLDFKTNRLGTCKHLGYAIPKIRRKRGHSKLFKAGYQQRHSSIYLDYKSNIRQVKLSIGTEDKKAYSQLAKVYFDRNKILNLKGFSQFEKLLEAARKINPSFRCYDDALEFVLIHRGRINRQSKIKQLFKNGLKSKLFDQLLNIKLYDYQKEGVLFTINAGRCLLADDMGLGKTVQAIAAAEFYKKHFNISRAIIICPTSLKYQWKHEIERFTKSKAHVIEGSALKRREQYKTNEDFYHILGYRMAANDLRHLNQMEADLVILDEAQRIKNWKTKTSTALKKLRSHYAIVLTGTPIENKLEELYSIMQFIDQFKLGPLYRFLDRYQITDPQSGKIIGYQNLKEIARNLKDVLLRRTKKKVLMQMPKRQDKVLLVPMTQEQREVHEELADNVARLVHKWRRMNFLNEQDRKRLMLSLSKMRMVCDSTYILDLKTRYDTKILELMCILEEFFANPNEKVVIFSQWARMNNLVAEELESRKMPYQYLHGGVPSKKRQDLLKSFREDPECRVFLSTDAGGVGLNLQAASLVINLDVPWNPAILEQRIARVYRLGQKRPVQVINLVSAQSIEHRMLDVLKFKNSMAKGVLDDGEDAIFLSGSKFSNFMGKIEDLTGGETKTDYEESLSDIQKEANEQNRSIDEGPKKPSFIQPEEQEAITSSPDKTISENIDTPEQIVQNGMAFFQGMMAALQSPEKTNALVKNITEKDEKTGQTYLKIPIESEQMVQNALKVLGGLFTK